MKKIIVLILIFSQAAFAYSQNNAVIKELTGTVELQKAGAQNWTAARAGEQVSPDTIISTGFRSTAILTVGSSTLTVQPITRLSLSELLRQTGEETVNINLNTGRIRVDVNPSAGTRASVSVQSPSATASVRGTSFEMDTVSLKVLTGSVSFEPADKSSRAVIANAGEASAINAETGEALHPMAVAEANSTLPLLPGEIASSFTLDRGMLAVMTGSFEVEITLSGEKN